MNPDPATDRADAGRRLREVVEEIELADQVGLDVLGVGEHHRPDFAVSSPAVVLAAGAARTQRIRLRRRHLPARGRRVLPRVQGSSLVAAGRVTEAIHIRRRIFFG